MMSSENGTNKRHNPVDSICRKIKTIQMMDQVSNPALQIPKFQSRNFDSPQTNIKKNLEEILKKRTFKSHETSGPCFLSPTRDTVFSPCPQAMGRRQRTSDFHAGNATYSIGKNKEKTGKPWLPIGQIESSPSLLKTGDTNIYMGQLWAASNTERKDLPPEDSYLTSSPNLPFLTTVQKAECFAFQSPVVKRLSLSERGWQLSWVNKADNTYDVSLICEEDLLTTIFCACDTERRGKVAVSKIVDYLRHTTSRGSEDSGLEELCNMLDPDKRDISMDLETYHAIMKEWIEDCKRKWEDTSKETAPSTEDSVFKVHESILTAKKTPARTNITSGSLEAIGGDVSKGDLETSDLITCVADLQFKNQKLQEENSKLKLTVEALEETSNKLMEDHEDLHNQIKSAQQSVMRAKSLKEELEEMKINLNISEEKTRNVVTQHKQLEKENQSLIIKISSLQEENIRNALDTDGLHKKIEELSKNASELQMQVHVYESTVVNKDAILLKRDLAIQELKSTIVEYSSVIETLRMEKNKLVNDIQQIQQELISNGIDFPLIYKFNSSTLDGTNSLHSELALAQQSSEVTGLQWAALDETLDREVLLLLQGPEQMGENLKATIQQLQEEASEAEEFVVTALQGVADPKVNVWETYETKLMDLKQVLEEKRNCWIKKLHLLEEHRESLDKEFVRMAGNLRRLRTEQLHFRKELSSRQHELEAVKQQQEEAVRQADALGLQLQEATRQLEDSSKQIKDRDGALCSAWEEAGSLQCVLEEAISEQRNLQAMNAAVMSSCQTLQEKVNEQTTIANALREKLFKGQLCGLLCQSCIDGESIDYSPLSSLNQATVKGKKICCFKKFEGQEASQCTGLLQRPSSGYSCWWHTPLLDALALEILHLNRRVRTCSDLTSVTTSAQSRIQGESLKNGSTLDVTLEGHKWKIRSAGNQTHAGFVASLATMDSLFIEDSGALPLTSDNPALSSEHSTASQEEVIAAALKSILSTECLTMETELSEASVAKDEDISTSTEVKKNEDKDLNDNVSGTDLTNKGDFCPIMENRKTTPERELKLEPETDGELESIQEQSGEVSAAVLDGKENSSPTMTGLKVTKTTPNDTISPDEKEVEAEFLRLSLGFKCDLFTLDKRVRLEERSRDLAEENLRKEIMNGLKLLESLAPLCEEDNQAQEIIKKLQKSLQFLSQYAARVASRAEMLGAINQESRVSKAVEVMIQHVENLKRMYTKEHAELEELKQVLLQNERCFSSFGDQDDSANKKFPSSLNFKPPSSLRRVSIAALPRNVGSTGIGLQLAQLYGTDGSERSDKIHRRSSSWGRLGTKQNEKRPSLQRFISTYSWVESEEEQSETKTEQVEPSVEEIREDQARKINVTERGKNLSKWSPGSACNMSSWASPLKTSFSKANKTLWISLTIIVLLAALTSFLAGLSLQRPADAAPVGTGDSWKSLQQLLWPYTKLQHNGPPPV